MGTPHDDPAAQMAEVLDRLHEEYPDTGISLQFSNRLELLVAVVLSAQCTDERVNKVTADLFEQYRTPEEYAEADQDELAEDLNSVTYYNNKAEYIRTACQRIVEEHGGEVPDTMSALTELPGVGRKTANVVLQHGHDVVEGVVGEWQQLTHLLISHGRAVCTARNPDCGDCVLEDTCPSSKLDGDVDLASGEAW
ncbi:endonuclease III [Halobacteriales archaeon QH_7_66_37]|nr:MAG: endonuclease III [Halobacteriales archaeon QH_7_66_37]